jgi:hypothetical protein
MSLQSSGYLAPTSGNRPVKESWAGKPLCDLDAVDVLSMRSYIFSEASSLGHNHGRRKCADARATNPFHLEFFLGKPHRFWNEVYLQSARQGAAIVGKDFFTEDAIKRPLDALQNHEVLFTLSSIEALKDLNELYCAAMDDLHLERVDPLINEWAAALIWYDLDVSDFSMLKDYRKEELSSVEVANSKQNQHQSFQASDSINCVVSYY